MKEDGHHCRKVGNGRERRRKGRTRRRAAYSDGVWVMTRVKRTPSLSGKKEMNHLYIYIYNIFVKCLISCKVDGTEAGTGAIHRKAYIHIKYFHVYL